MRCAAWSREMLALALTGGLVVSSCSKDPTSSHGRTGGIYLVIAWDHRGGQPPGMEKVPALLPVDSLSVEVDGPGMSPVRVVVPVVENQASGTIDGIAAGPNRVVTALAWSADPRVDLYRGTDTVTIEAGKTTPATLVMYQLQRGPVGVVDVDPDTTYAGHSVIADASASYDCYAPDTELSFRFLVSWLETASWSASSRDTFPAPTRGSWQVGVIVRNLAGSLDSAYCTLQVLNTAPNEPTNPFPQPGDTVSTLAPWVRWAAVDPDGDALSAVVWFGTDSLAVAEEGPSAASLTAEADSAQLTSLEPLTRYFWKVSLSDQEATTEGGTWDFLTARETFTVSPDSLRFPCGTDQLSVEVRAAASFPLDWTAAADDPWLDVSPRSGSVGGVPQYVWITILSRAGHPPGVVWGSVTFEGGGFVVPVHVGMDVAPSLGSAIPDSLILVVPAFEDTVDISNSGCGDLSWAVHSVGSPWLTPLPASGVVPEGDTGTLRVRADTTGLEPGDHRTTMVLSMLDMSFLIHAVARVPSALCVDVIPDSIHIAAASPSGQCEVENCGTATLVWTASWNEPWITVEPVGGTLSPFTSEPVSITADIAGLPSGLLHTGVWFSSGEAETYLTLTVMVPGRPMLEVIPTQLALPADTDTAGFTIRNSGSGALSWSLAEVPSWATVAPSEGLLGPSEQVHALLSADRVGLAPGPHQDSLAIMSNGGTQVVSVDLDVGTPGCDPALYGEDFNTGDAPGWAADPSAGQWSVEDGRYVVRTIPEGARGWSEHGLDIQGPVMGQVDIHLESSPSPDVYGAVCLVAQAGSTIRVQGVNCDAVAASLGSDGAVKILTRAAATGVWVACAESQSSADPDVWNAVAILLDETRLAAILNGGVVTTYTYPFEQQVPPLGTVALMAWTGDTLRFDRVFVCPE